MSEYDIPQPFYTKYAYTIYVDRARHLLYIEDKSKVFRNPFCEYL